MTTKEEASSDFSSARCLLVGKRNDWLSPVFFLGVRGAPHIPVGMETFYSRQVSWSSEDINLLEWAFGEAIAKEEKCWYAAVRAVVSPICTLLLQLSPRKGW